MQSLFQQKGHDCPTPTTTSLNNMRDFGVKDTSIDRSLNSSHQRCSTHERLQKPSEESLRNMLETSQRTSQSQLTDDKGSSHNSSTHTKVKINNLV